VCSGKGLHLFLRSDYGHCLVGQGYYRGSGLEDVAGTRVAAEKVVIRAALYTHH
jgi:hypothetical protein